MAVEEQVERKSNPVFKMKEGIPLNGEKILKMNTAEPLTSGTTQYGEWNLWSANVENATVFEGRKPNEKKIEGYTGEVIFFATEKMNKELINTISSEEGVELKVKKEPKETQKGLVYVYTFEKLGGKNPEKTPIPSGLTMSEHKLVNDANSLVKSGYDLSEDDFVRASKDEALYGNITEERVKELYKFVGK